MQHFFQKYDISLSTEQLQGFETFLELFQKTNNQINLSAIRDEEGIITKHFIDSLMLTRFLDEITKNFQPPTSNLQLLDLGTGGGFPGIPLAIYYPNHHFTLLDARKKKCECIKNFVEKLGLENVSVVWGRAEEPEKWELLKNSKFRVQNSE